MSVGDSQTTLVKRTDQSAMNAWGEMSGDRNPLHCDPEYAARSRYGGTILHGHMTVAWLMDWAKRRWGYAWVSAGEIRGLRYRRPLRPGVDYEVLPVEELDDGSVRLEIRDPDGETAATCLAALRSDVDA